MVDDDIIASLGTGDENDGISALVKISELKSISSEEAQLLANLLVPFWKSNNNAVITLANGAFSNLKNQHPSLCYPEELMNSEIQVRNIFGQNKIGTAEIKETSQNGSKFNLDESPENLKLMKLLLSTKETDRIDGIRMLSGVTSLNSEAAKRILALVISFYETAVLPQHKMLARSALGQIKKLVPESEFPKSFFDVQSRPEEPSLINDHYSRDQQSTGRIEGVGQNVETSLCGVSAGNTKQEIDQAVQSKDQSLPQPTGGHSWYESVIFLIPLLLFCFPVGCIFLWVGKRFSILEKLGFSFFFFLFWLPQILPERFSDRDLQKAINNGNEEVVQKILNSGANVETLLPSGETPLITAARMGRLNVVELLIRHGAKINVHGVPPIGNERYSPLHWATDRGDAKIVDVLIKKGANVNDGARHWCPIHSAAVQRNTVVGELLLRAGADPNSTTTEGETPMVLAEKDYPRLNSGRGKEAFLTLLKNFGGR